MPLLEAGLKTNHLRFSEKKTLSIIDDIYHQEYKGERNICKMIIVARETENGEMNIDRGEFLVVDDRYRKLRNGINYYGEDISIETINESLREIPEIEKKLRKSV